RAKPAAALLTPREQARQDFAASRHRNAPATAAGCVAGRSRLTYSTAPAGPATNRSLTSATASSRRNSGSKRESFSLEISEYTTQNRRSLRSLISSGGIIQRTIFSSLP